MEQTEFAGWARMGTVSNEQILFLKYSRYSQKKCLNLQVLHFFSLQKIINFSVIEVSRMNIEFSD